MNTAQLMPHHVGVRFAHAAVQVIADSVGVDLLHIKGPAVHPSLLQTVTQADRAGVEHQLAEERRSMDADVLVRPTHLARLLEALHQHGWVLKVDFADGSAFEHAATFGHDVLAHLDVHRSFPGFSAGSEQVFLRLWQERRSLDIAGITCTVPDPTAQRLLLIINAVRDGVGGQPESDRLWQSATPEEQEALRLLAYDLRAQVALAAATGDLGAHVGASEYHLWRLLSTGQGTSVDLWLARVRAQPTARAAFREAVKLVVPNPRRLGVQIGRPLTRREMGAAWRKRLSQGVRGVRDLVRQRRKRGRG